MSWLSFMLAMLAIMTLGPVVPLETMDGWFGGTNVIWLAQCVFAMFAFWAFAEAIKRVVTDGSKNRTSAAVPLMFCVGTIVTFFAEPNRAPTTEHFSRMHADSLGIMTSSLIYMAGMCWSAVDIMRGSQGRASLGYLFFRIGAGFVILGCGAEAAALIADHCDWFGVDEHSILYQGFAAFFYPGVAMIVIGAAVFKAQRWRRVRRSRWLFAQLRGILEQNGIVGSFFAGDRIDAYAVWGLLVRVMDHRILGNVRLSYREEQVVLRAEQWIEDNIPQMQDAIDEGNSCDCRTCDRAGRGCSVVVPGPVRVALGHRPGAQGGNLADQPA
ncbi:MAG TPA: hypothetical protein VFU07_05010 [Candidatus Lumbricidophila sp.]|nr:hypothetical protein [Candidatus Lumbricidophila sp.]